MDRDVKLIAKLERHVRWVRQNIGQSQVLSKRLSEISKLRAAAVSDQKPRLVVHNPSPLPRK